MKEDYEEKIMKEVVSIMEKYHNVRARRFQPHLSSAEIAKS